MKKGVLLLLLIVIVAGIWLASAYIRIHYSQKELQCHIALCEENGLNSSITSVERLYLYDLPDNYVSCLSDGGGYTEIYSGKDIKSLCAGKNFK